jgi:hypothetical protein
MAKMARERRLQEKRERKAEKKEARKLAAAEGRDPDAVVDGAAEAGEGDDTVPAEPAADDASPAV